MTSYLVQMDRSLEGGAWRAEWCHLLLKSVGVYKCIPLCSTTVEPQSSDLIRSGAVLEAICLKTKSFFHPRPPSDSVLTFLLCSTCLMYCLIYNQTFLKLIKPPSASLKWITFSTHSRGVLQEVSMQHLHVIASKILSLANYLSFIQINNRFSLSPVACVVSFTPLAALALLRACFKIVLIVPIVHFASNKSKKTKKNPQK